MRSALLYTFALLSAACAIEPASEEEVVSGTSDLSGVSGLDPRFGKSGMVSGASVASESTARLTYDGQGRTLVLSGKPYEDNGLIVQRYDAKGALDASYAKSRIAAMVSDESIFDVQALADGSAVVFASALCIASTCPFDFDKPGKLTRYVFKLRADGTHDTSFAGGKGFLTYASARRGEIGTYGLRLAKNERDEVAVVADDEKGALRIDWISAQGAVLSSASFSNVEAQTSAVAAYGNNVFVARAAGDPSITSSKGKVYLATKGKNALTPGDDTFSAKFVGVPIIRKLVATKDALWVLGYGQDPKYSTPHVLVAKLAHDLFRDPFFGEAGINEFRAGRGKGGQLNDLVAFPDGRVVLVGGFEKDGGILNDNQLAFVGLNKDGDLDHSFGSRGILLVDGGSKGESLTDIRTSKEGVFAAGFSGGKPIFTKLAWR